MNIFSSSLLALTVTAFSAMAEEPAPLPDDTAKINYSVGYQIGSDFKYQDIEVRPDAVIQGILDAINEDETLLTPAEMKQVTAELGKRLAEQKRKQKEALRQELIDQSHAFHEKNKKRSDIVTTESGLQYRIMEPGRGVHPKATDSVVVNYTGKLIDGTEFDSSYKRGKPASFKVKGVIKGWTEALQLMKQGARWQLFIPYELAYGEEGRPPVIPPYSSLIFDINLISIE
ncbi:MAG: FKBP-type peptidyl-prolyl cis-trans isomerase [Candidatus Thiodiazotropha sp.]|jgi:FKBP-type peptidyl-prolyl cis-trans isomerase FklB